jgi:hypothetical protein
MNKSRIAGPRLPTPSFLLISLSFALLGVAGFLYVLLIPGIDGSKRIMACFAAAMVFAYFGTHFMRETRYRSRFYAPEFEREYFSAFQAASTGMISAQAIEQLSRLFAVRSDEVGVTAKGPVRVVDFLGVHAYIRMIVRNGVVDRLDVTPRRIEQDEQI